MAGLFAYYGFAPPPQLPFQQLQGPWGGPPNPSSQFLPPFPPLPGGASNLYPSYLNLPNGLPLSATGPYGQSVSAVFTTAPPQDMLAAALQAILQRNPNINAAQLANQLQTLIGAMQQAGGNQNQFGPQLQFQQTLLSQQQLQQNQAALNRVGLGNLGGLPPGTQAVPSTFPWSGTAQDPYGRFPPYPGSNQPWTWYIPGNINNPTSPNIPVSWFQQQMQNQQPPNGPPPPPVTGGGNLPVTVPRLQPPNLPTGPLGLFPPYISVPASFGAQVVTGGTPQQVNQAGTNIVQQGPGAWGPLPLQTGQIIAPTYPNNGTVAQGTITQQFRQIQASYGLGTPPSTPSPGAPGSGLINGVINAFPNPTPVPAPTAPINWPPPGGPQPVLPPLNNPNVVPLLPGGWITQMQGQNITLPVAWSGNANIAIPADWSVGPGGSGAPAWANTSNTGPSGTTAAPASGGGGGGNVIPTITGLSPSSGFPSTSVTISGTGFTGATQVKFGTVVCLSWGVQSDTTIRATAPVQGSGVVDVTVSTAAGTSAIVAADNFTYN